MTFSELCKQTARECGVGVSYDQMQKILATQWRIIIEELLIVPGQGRVMLHGLLQIYTKRKRLNCGIWKDGECVAHEQHVHYCYRIKPSIVLKKVMAGEIPMEELKIGKFPLYFEKTQLKRPKKDFKHGEMMLDEMNRKKVITHRKDFKDIKAKAEQDKLSKRLPED